jgi:hypothetical protein
MPKECVECGEDPSSVTFLRKIIISSPPPHPSHQKDITQRIVTVTLKRYYHVPIHCTMICKNSKFSKQFPNVR